MLKKITDFLKYVKKPKSDGETSTHDENDKGLNIELVITNVLMDDEPITTQFDDNVHIDI